MDPITILYPGFAMFSLTFGVVATLGYNRYRAIRHREVSIRYYRLYNEGEQTERLQQLGRHVQNHFEVPPLFYIALLFTFAAGTVSVLQVGLAWAYVGSRCIHSWIHLGKNDVTKRFIVFVTSGIILGALWFSIFIAMRTEFPS